LNRTFGVVQRARSRNGLEDLSPRTSPDV